MCSKSLFYKKLISLKRHELTYLFAFAFVYRFHFQCVYWFHFIDQRFVTLLMPWINLIWLCLAKDPTWEANVVVVRINYKRWWKRVAEFQEKRPQGSPLIHVAKLFPRNCQKLNWEGLKLVISVLSITSSSPKIILRSSL